MRASRYNFAVTHQQGVTLFNARTGATYTVKGRDAEALGAALTGDCNRQIDLQAPDAVIQRLLEGEFLTSRNDAEELAMVAEKFSFARSEAPMVITIVTTIECNLACYYCYEARTGESLKQRDGADIVFWAHERLRATGKRSLHVDWFGGEPLLNADFLEGVSLDLQSMCADLGISYSASIVSNGTLWPKDLGAFIARHRVRQVQISLDGLSEEHNKRRRYRRGYRPGDGSTSFDRATAGIDALLAHTRVDVRVNLDRENARDVLGLVELARVQGWYDRQYPFKIYPARLSKYSERSAFMIHRDIPVFEFEAIVEAVESAMDPNGEEVAIPEPVLPRTGVCAALAPNSVVFGADTRLYRCGLQVSEPHRSVGSASSPDPSRSGSNADKANALWWEQYNPTMQVRCGQCSFLPVCWGGCPKHHLEGDAAALEYQCSRWRRQLAGRILATAGMPASETPHLPEIGTNGQFRTEFIADDT